MEKLDFDCVIIGGGAVGLACAWKISEQNPSLRLLLIDKNERLGAETSSRNSEVIHAGIYYEPGSHKEQLCIEGKHQLYAFCKKYEVPYRCCEKLIVGWSQEELAGLQKISQAAHRNQVPIVELDQAAIQRLEPNISGKYGLCSPTTGIICSETYIQRLAQLVERNGVTLVTQNELVHWEYHLTRGYELQIRCGGKEIFAVHSPVVINAAGLYSLKIAAAIFQAAAPVQMKFVRGHYFLLSQRYQGISSRLIYPLPDIRGGGLGIHLTIDLEANARLGPDTDWRHTDRLDYFFDEDDELTEKFFEAARRYLPQLRQTDLKPGFVGIRPKLISSEGKPADFYIQEEKERGYPGWVNLIGIESPGLTASLAIGDKVLKLIQ